MFQLCSATLPFDMSGDKRSDRLAPWALVDVAKLREGQQSKCAGPLGIRNPVLSPCHPYCGGSISVQSMPTRLKRPPFWRPLGLTVALLGFQGYLGFSAIGGQFGIENRVQILADIDVLKAQSSALQAEIEAFSHRATLMDSRRLDPDIVTERARALLNMANADDILIMVDPASGKPLSGSFADLTEDQLNTNSDVKSTL